MKSLNFWVSTSTVAVLGAAMLAVPATAQDTVDDNYREIVVTATRTSEAVSRVPISVSVFDQSKLDAQGIRGIEDAARMTPGVNFSPTGFGAQSEISIRGVSSNIGAATVGIYVDDTPIQAAGLGFGNQNAYPKMFDLERVEILRGPQGTLFGGSSQGGTIRFITPAPGLQEWTGYTRAEVSETSGGGMNYEFGSAVGGPLVTDKVAIRASAYYRHDGGYIDRVDYITGTLKDKNSNAMDSYVLRGAITLAPTEELKITGTLFYQKTRTDDASVMWRVLSDRENGKFLSGQRQPSTDRDEILLPSLKMEYNGDGFDIVTNTSYMIRDNDPSVDYSTTVPGIFAGSAYLAAFPNYEATAELQNRYRSFVQEARIQSAGDQKLRWVAGLYYNRLKQAAAEQIIDGQFGDLIEYIFEAPFVDVTSMDLIDGKYSYIQDFRTKSTELAAFVDLNYEIVPRVRVSVGARVSQNKYESKNYVTGAFNFGTGNSATQIKETPFTPKFGVNWQIDDRNMVYATAAKGYRTGGGNIVFDNPACAADLASRGYTSVPETYKSDHLWSYEVGTKNRIGSLQIAASAFHIKWNSIQQNVMLNNCGLQFTDNLGTATSDGFDLQLSKKFGDLLLSAQVGYTNSRYSETVALSDDENILPIVRKGNALQQQPWSFTISGQYDFNLVEMPSFVRVDYNNLSGRRTLAAQDQETSTFDPNRLGSEPYSVLNARVGMNVSDVELSVFANNILNASPRLSSLSEGGTLYLKETTLRPRVIGLNASYRY